MRTLILIAAVAVATAPAAAQSRPRNLQVLPDTLTRKQVAAMMLDVAGALGVQCLYCHEGADMSSIYPAEDGKATKRVARETMRMVGRINTELGAAFPARAPSPQVTCMTCHRGAVRPTLLEDTLHAVIRSAGIDAGIAAYDSLRAR